MKALRGGPAPLASPPLGWPTVGLDPGGGLVLQEDDQPAQPLATTGRPGKPAHLLASGTLGQETPAPGTP